MQSSYLLVVVAPHTERFAFRMLSYIQPIFLCIYIAPTLHLQSSHSLLCLLTHTLDVSFKSLVLSLHSCVLTPSKSEFERLVEAALEHHGIVYIRTTRLATPIIYGPEEKFYIGGCKVVRQSDRDLVTVIGAGVTLFEALAAYAELQQEGINIRVIDLYSVKPVDAATLLTAAKATRGLITVEDHYPAGGIGEAVMAALAPNPVRLYALAVTKKPKTGKPAELLTYEDISRSAIVKLVKEIILRRL